MDDKIVIDKCLKDLNELYKRSKQIKETDPDHLRVEYDGMMSMIEKKEVEVDDKINDMQEILRTEPLEEAKTIIYHNIDVLNEIKESYMKLRELWNEARIGTLEGLSRQTIKNKRIPRYGSYQTIFDQPHNESRGGRKPNKKRRSNKRRKSNKRRTKKVFSVILRLK
jgi:hypothetical protein